LLDGNVFFILLIVYVKKLESCVSGTYSVFIGWFVRITPSVGELVTRKCALVVVVTYPLSEIHQSALFFYYYVVSSWYSGLLTNVFSAFWWHRHVHSLRKIVNRTTNLKGVCEPQIRSGDSGEKFPPLPGIEPPLYGRPSHSVITMQTKSNCLMVSAGSMNICYVIYTVHIIVTNTLTNLCSW
jgi:hypothetical protein